MAARKVSNVAGLERTLKALRQDDVLEDVDEALVAAARGLAAAVDADPGNGALWREYRAVLASLKEVAAGGIDDEAAAFLRAVSVRTSLGDPA